MKAVVLEKLRSPLSVLDLDIPDRLEFGQVLVKMIVSTICGAQIGEIDGLKGEDKYLPHLLGHEGCGRVEAIGPGVTRVKVKDKVALHWRKGAGIEAVPAKYHCAHEQRVIGAGPVSTFAEYSIISENRMTVVDEETPPNVASLMGCAVTTALGLVNNEAQLKLGDSIAVAGVGGVGLNVVQGARMVSASTVIAIDTFSSKLDIAQRFGATHRINSSIFNIVSGVLETCPKGVNVFVDCTGDPKVINDGLSCLASGGRLILVGQVPVNVPLIFVNGRNLYRGITILDSQGGLTNPNEDIPKYLSLYRSGYLPLDGIVTHAFPLSEVNEAISLIKRGESIRVALEA